VICFKMKLNKRGTLSDIIIIFIAFIIAFIVLILLIDFYEKESEVCFNKDCFEVEIADTPQLRIHGLSFREELDKDKGMLFAYAEEGDYAFWMKDVSFPLDIIWINKNFEVVFIKKDSRPCINEECIVISSPVKARYVLELNAGSVRKIGLEVGNKVVFHIE